MIENAYKNPITDSTGLHIERSQLCFEIAIIDKSVFLSKFVSEIIPKIMGKGTNSNQEQYPLSTDDGRQRSLEMSNLNKGQVKSTHAEIVAMLVSLLSCTINRYLLPDNQNLLQGRVYIPETVMVASSPSSKITRNQFLVPIPDPICSTRIVSEM